MVSMHSNAYNEFIQKVETDGYIQGYNSKLFESILPQERDDVEHIIEKKFNDGDYEMAIFMPQLSNINGIGKLEEEAQKLKKGSYAYCEIMYVLYNATKKEIYLDKLIQILKSNNEDERMNALMSLLRCGKSNKLYKVYKNQCISDEDEDVRSRCVIGMLYCQNIIKDPLRIQTLEQPWSRLKVEMYDDDMNGEDRIKAIQEFEELLGMIDITNPMR